MLLLCPCQSYVMVQHYMASDWASAQHWKGRKLQTQGPTAASSLGYTATGRWWTGREKEREINERKKRLGINTGYRIKQSKERGNMNGRKMCGDITKKGSEGWNRFKVNQRNGEGKEDGRGERKQWNKLENKERKSTGPYQAAGLPSLQPYVISAYLYSVSNRLSHPVAWSSLALTCFALFCKYTLQNQISNLILDVLFSLS